MDAFLSRGLEVPCESPQTPLWPSYLGFTLNSSSVRAAAGLPPWISLKEVVRSLGGAFNGALSSPLFGRDMGKRTEDEIQAI